MKQANVVDSKVEIEHIDAMAALCEKLGDLTTLDDCSTDEEELVRRPCTCITLENDLVEDNEEDEEDALIIRAHIEFTKSGDRNYVISDSGADSSILGMHCHVISYTGRHAYLMGYDPA
jgi:hypothetical protein